MLVVLNIAFYKLIISAKKHGPAASRDTLLVYLCFHLQQYRLFVVVVIRSPFSVDYAVSSKTTSFPLLLPCGYKVG
jgi:hypothetical protein